MKYSEYKEVYNNLNRYSDIKRYAAEKGYDREFLFVIYTQRRVRATTGRYYQIKNQTPALLKKWKRGVSFNKLAWNLNFSPVMLAFLLMKENGVPRKQFWRFVRGEEEPPTNRLKKEIKAIRRRDMVYSPRGMELQEARGKMGEERLYRWLDEKGLTYKTEEDLRGEGKKTPDALLEKPFKYNGKELYWFESKANFGDKIEIRKNARQQLVPYTELFGPGMVVYWFGYVDEAPEYKDVFITDASFFE